MTPFRLLLTAALLLAPAAPVLTQTAQAQTAQLQTAPLQTATPGVSLPADRPIGQLELVHAFMDQMPVGVTFSLTGRTFISYPRWDRPAAFTLGELVNGREVAYPNADFAAYRPGLDPATHLVSAQGVAVDAKNRLWVLDNGSLNFADILSPRAAKLVAIDLNTNRVVKTIYFPADVVPPATYLNDLRVDLKRGQDGAAYLTDSGERSMNGIIVVDLATGHSWRKLKGDPSVKAEPGYVGFVQGKALLDRSRTMGISHPATGVDGLAISADGQTLYYGPNSGRTLYSIPTDVLWDEQAPATVVSAAVRNLGQKGGSADGLGEDASGNIYLTNYEANAVSRRTKDGDYQTIAHDPRLLWPDTIALYGGYLYVTSNQLDGLSGYNFGQNVQRPPFSLWRVRVDQQPLHLR